MKEIDYTKFDSIDLESWLILHHPDIYEPIKYFSNLYEIIGRFCNAAREFLSEGLSIYDFLEVSPENFHSND